MPPHRTPPHPGGPAVRRTAAIAMLVAACGVPAPDTSPGVSLALAQRRAAEISNVRYDVSVSIPQDRATPVRGTVRIRFTLRRPQPVILDFTAPEGSVARVAGADGRPIAYEAANGHLVIPRSAVGSGDNTVTLEFVAGDRALNRSDDFLYSLFVPDRASSALPCFDQPDLKARLRLTLELPLEWRAVSNAPAIGADTTGDRVTIRFDETPPLPTYLFAFVAGRFQVDSAVRNGRPMRFFHRETDHAKIARNREAIFDLHATAVRWLEEYTGIAYPFPKFDFVAIPAFQFGGMEHPGAILYRAESLFLDQSATQSQELGRASVIAHETAHMWFGDLVTMRWFDDVWMKEVFANFMAAKIVNPSFPKLDHALRFYLAHHPAAYEVDRTAGANPIRQPLDNLARAGSLYGAIIYQKAPIVMRHLELLMGEEPLRDGLRIYLGDHRYGNASWTDLITVLDSATPVDLAAWSRVWVEEARRPTIRAAYSLDHSGRIGRLTVTQEDPAGRDRRWPQRLTVALGTEDGVRVFPVRLDARETPVPAALGLPRPDYVLVGADGLAYGHFVPDSTTIRWLLRRLPSVEPAVRRGGAMLDLWEAMLDGRATPPDLIGVLLHTLSAESDVQLAERELGFVRAAFWRWLDEADRRALAPTVETAVWNEITGDREPARRAAAFDAYVDLALTPEATARLERLWRGTEHLRGLPLAERHYTALAEALALREVAGADSILDAQARRIGNPDRRRRFEFLSPALSADPSVRDSVFASFKDPRNRSREAWVLSAQTLLNHPLRAAQAVRYVRPSLELLEEIERTGDIFFPLRWLNATLEGHQSVAAAADVVAFLTDRPTYPQRLREKVLQAADPLFRVTGVTFDGRTEGE